MEITGLGSNLLWKAESAKKEGSGATFGSVLASSIREVQASSKLAEEAAAAFLSGEGIDLHEVALASQKASLTMDLFLQSRNKIVQAYQEVMRMQV